MVPEILTNCNLFVDGRGYAGKVLEVNLPKLKRKTEAYRAGGMDAEIDMPVGLEKLEGSFSLAGMNPDVLVFFGVADGEKFNGSFRGAFTNQKGAVVKAVATWRGLLTENDPGSWKPGDKGEHKFTASLTYYKLEVDSKVIYELDPVNGVRTIDGVDELKAERDALGM